MTSLRALPFLFALGLADPPQPLRPWKALEAQQAIIQHIQVEIQNVFDLTRPEENIWLGRAANRFHASTREAVIRRVLLFREGDRVRARRIYETERLLRALPFLKDARIDPVQDGEGGLVARVRVRDAWTTEVGAGFASVGGQRSSEFSVDEKNFLGHGKSVATRIAKDHERRTWGLAYRDPQLFGSRWTLALQSQYRSDGLRRRVELERPFFALDTPWAARASLDQEHAALHLYDRGAQVFQAPIFRDEVQLALAAALPLAGDRVWRAGMLFQRRDTRFGPLEAVLPAGSLPPPVLVDRRLRGLAATLATQRDAFEAFQDLQGMDTPEDYNLAWNGTLALGATSRALGSTRGSPFFRFQASSGWSGSPGDLSLLTLAWEARVPGGTLENSLLSASWVQYGKLSANRILAARVGLDLGRRLDPDAWYYLGGDQGLRGFANALHPGDGRWTASFEYRILTEHRWWGLVRLGYCGFADFGSIRRMDGQGWSRTYADVGFALRLGNLKSSLGRVILLSLAVPLNREPYLARWQFTIGNAQSF